MFSGKFPTEMGESAKHSKVCRQNSRKLSGSGRENRLETAIFSPFLLTTTQITSISLQQTLPTIRHRPGPASHDGRYKPFFAGSHENVPTLLRFPAGIAALPCAVGRKLSLERTVNR